jgi:hypothetical protein
MPLELDLDPVSEQEILFKTYVFAIFDLPLGSLIVPRHGKLFQFDYDTEQWKKLGTGIVRLLAEETQQVRLVIREDITCIIAGN